MKRPRIIVIGAVAAGVGLILLWAGAFERAGDASPVVYVDDPSEASRAVDLVRVDARTVENFLGHQIVEVEATLWNTSERPLRSLEVRLVFYGFDGEEVFEARDEGLRTPAPPGEQRSSVFRFEDLPREWNRRAPSVEIVRVGY